MFMYSILLLIMNRRYLPDAIKIRSYRVGALVFSGAFFGVLSAITIVDQVGDHRARPSSAGVGAVPGLQAGLEVADGDPVTAVGGARGAVRAERFATRF